MKSGKRETTRGIELQNQESIIILEKKERKLIVLGNSGRTKWKGVREKNKTTSQNLAVQQKSNPRNIHLARIPCKILSAILKIDIGRTQTNWPKDKTDDDNEQGLTSERWNRQTIYVKKRRWMTHLH